MAVFVFKQMGSTNAECKNPCYAHGDAVVAVEQTAGRGQRGNTWSSKAGENLTFSLVWEADFLAAREQFLLSEAVALALVDTLAGYGLEAHIKWPNDIYVGHKKICGILIEHDLGMAGRLARTIVGIGLNVNQTEWDESIPNPTSIALLTGERRGTNDVFGDLYEALERRFEQLKSAPQSVQTDYLARLYRLNKPSTYALPDGKQFRGTIRDVRPTGELMVEHEDGGFVKPYLFKEIEFVLNGR
ncbi:MAG: biotin--[acetyl-CoA-carboxylase] ligase [Tidjanibacter sp.]|nr:biotin--[acetyl-CoA-carboxylase] ligase [Tidjanibacter sp.]